MTGRALSIAAVLILLGSSALAISDNSVAFCFRSCATFYHQSALTEKVYDRLVSNPRMNLARPELCDSILQKNTAFGSDRFDPALMTEMAVASNSRYLVWLRVEEAGIRKSARTYIPYVFRSHHRKYVLCIRMFVLDSYSGKTVETRRYESTKKGPAIMSYMDYDPNDPGLIQSYPELGLRFAEMEDEIADLIATDIEQAVRRR